MNSATNGCKPTMLRAIGLCLVLTATVFTLITSSASAMKASTPTNYVGLGDSLAFGYTQEKFEANYPTEAPAEFEDGYVTILGKKLAHHEKQLGNALTTVNLGCPGEVSDGLIGENEALGGNGEGYGKSDASPCPWHKSGFPLHFDYGAPPSQLETALEIIDGAVPELGETKWMTINIGSNDELRVLAACENQKYLEYRSFTYGFAECVTVEAGEGKEGEEEFDGQPLTGKQFYKGGLGHIVANIGTVIRDVRGAGYSGPVGVLGFYAPQALVLPGSEQIQKRLNEAIEHEITSGAFGDGVVFANPYPMINRTRRTAEQRAICKYTEYCNVHDKEANFVTYLEKKYDLSHSEAEAYRESHREEAEKFPEGDTHPTPAGYRLLANLLYKAFGL